MAGRRASVWIAALLFGMAAAGAAHAGDSHCLWMNLSKFSQEQALAETEADAFAGLKAWSPTPGDFERMQSVCAGARQFPDQAKMAVRLYAVERVLERSLDVDRHFNSLNAEVTWETAPLQVRYRFRNWRLAGFKNQTPEPSAIEAANDLVRSAEQRGGKNIENDTPAVTTMLRYFAIRSMREEAEAGF